LLRWVKVSLLIIIIKDVDEWSAYILESLDRFACGVHHQ